MNVTNDKMRAELLELFDRYDVDNNGLIDEFEFGQILTALGEDSAEETLSLQFAAIDTDGDGAVRFQEFVDWWLDG